MTPSKTSPDGVLRLNRVRIHSEHPEGHSLLGTKQGLGLRFSDWN